MGEQGMQTGGGGRTKGRGEWDPRDAGKGTGEGTPQEVEGGQSSCGHERGSRRGYFVMKAIDHLVCWDTSGESDIPGQSRVESAMST